MSEDEVTQNPEDEVPPTDASAEESSPEGGGSIHDAKFAPLNEEAPGSTASNIDLLLDVTVTVSAEMGTRSLPLERVLELKQGSVVELDRPADEPIDLLVNGKPIARGEVVVVDDHFGVRITEILQRDRPLRREALEPQVASEE